MAKAKIDLYQAVTDSVIDGLQKIESGEIKTPPWVRNWSSIGACRNAFSGRQYTGMNAFMLPLYMSINGWDDPRFATYKAISEAGGQVKKNKKSVKVILWKFIEDRKDPTKKIPLLRSIPVFNVKAQTEGIELKGVEAPNPDERSAEIDHCIEDRKSVV